MRKRPREWEGEVTDRWAQVMERVKRRLRREGERRAGAGDGGETQGISIFCFSSPVFDILNWWGITGGERITGFFFIRLQKETLKLLHICVWYYSC